MKTTNSDFKDEENHDFNNCKSDNDMQLKKMIKSDNFNNFNDFDDENSSSKNENKNIDENEILLLNLSNSLTSKIVFTFTTNLIEKDR